MMDKGTRTIKDLNIEEKEEVINAASAVVIWTRLEGRGSDTTVSLRLKSLLKRYEELCHKHRLEIVEPKLINKPNKFKQ